MNLEYENVMKKLHSAGMFRINPGTERISEVLAAFNNPQENLKFIHVAGTNGKGSVCAICETILRKAGYKTGLYTSPHIFDYTERIKISGKNISKEVFSEYFNKAAEKAKICKIDLTEFEILTVMMFLIFSDNNVDVVILETGMGGRLDATNVIKQNLCSIITQIDLDHTEKLGKTKEKIAFEKAGIIKKNCPVFTSCAYEAIKDKADESDSLLVIISPEIDEKFVNKLSLKGIHQKENLALALGAINFVFPDISNELILNALSEVKHPFRFEYFPDKNLIIDAAHNPNGIEILRKNLDLHFPNEKRRYIFGCLKTKDRKKMMNTLFREGDEVFLYGFNYPNACTYRELASDCPVSSKNFYPDKFILNPDKLNIICGSFYYLKDLKQHGIINAEDI